MRTYCAASYVLMRDTLGKLKQDRRFANSSGILPPSVSRAKRLSPDFPAQTAPADTPEAQTFTGLNVILMPRVFSAASNAG